MMTTTSSQAFVFEHHRLVVDTTFLPGFLKKEIKKCRHYDAERSPREAQQSLSGMPPRFYLLHPCRTCHHPLMLSYVDHNGQVQQSFVNATSHLSLTLEKKPHFEFNSLDDLLAKFPFCKHSMLQWEKMLGKTWAYDPHSPFGKGVEVRLRGRPQGTYVIYPRYKGKDLGLSWVSEKGKIEHMPLTIRPSAFIQEHTFSEGRAYSSFRLLTRDFAHIFTLPLPILEACDRLKRQQKIGSDIHEFRWEIPDYHDGPPISPRQRSNTTR